MIKWAFSLLKKYRELVAYGVVGVMTTVINMVVFWLFNTPLAVHYTVANIIAWVLAVVFAFFANKIFVFENHGWSGTVVLHEATTFFLSRIASLLVDMAGMALMIDVLHCEEMLSKLVVNIVVILINYVLGKFWVFGKKAASKKASDGE
jgi:putative flippase GtrA